jgi:hypothetical protein
MKYSSDTHGSIVTANSHKEPAPITDKENPFTSMLQQFSRIVSDSLLLLLFSFLFMGSLFSQTKSNLEVFYSLVDSTTDQFISYSKPPPKIKVEMMGMYTQFLIIGCWGTSNPKELSRLLTRRTASHYSLTQLRNLLLYIRRYSGMVY